MPEQLSIFATPAEDKNVRWLEDLLCRNPGWRTAAEVLQCLGREPTDDQKRMIRALAQESEWLISGQKGYKHLEHATAEEVNRFANWMESQAREMTLRAQTLRRNAHRIFG